MGIRHVWDGTMWYAATWSCSQDCHWGQPPSTPPLRTPRSSSIFLSLPLLKTQMERQTGCVFFLCECVCEGDHRHCLRHFTFHVSKVRGILFWIFFFVGGVKRVFIAVFSSLRRSVTSSGFAAQILCAQHLMMNVSRSAHVKPNVRYKVAIFIHLFLPTPPRKTKQN